MLPLRNGVLFPGAGVPFVVGREASLAAVDAALAREDKDLVVCFQRLVDEEPRALADLRSVGVRAHIRTIQRTPEAMTVLVHGIERVGLDSVVTSERALFASVRPLPMLVDEGTDVEALTRDVTGLVQRLVQLAKGGEVPPLDALLRGDEDRVRFVFAVASLLDIEGGKAQELLEKSTVSDALRFLVGHRAREVKILEVRQEIVQQVAGQMDKEQREYVLRKQLQTIQNELGSADSEAAEVTDLRQRLEGGGLPEAALREAMRELGRLERMPGASHEHQVIRSYIELVLELPWSVESETRVDLVAARSVLDRTIFD